MTRKAQELQVLHQGATLEALILKDHRAHLVEERYPGNPAKVPETLFQGR